MGSQMTLNVVIDIGPVLSGLGAKLVALFDDITAELATMSTNVDAISAKLTQLEAQIAAGGMTADQESQVKAQIDALRDKIASAAQL